MFFQTPEYFISFNIVFFFDGYEGAVTSRYEEDRNKQALIHMILDIYISVLSFLLRSSKCDQRLRDNKKEESYRSRMFPIIPTPDQCGPVYMKTKCEAST